MSLPTPTGLALCRQLIADAPLDNSVYMPLPDYDKRAHAYYFDEKGNKRHKSSRSSPYKGKPFPVGTYVIEKFEGPYGHEFGCVARVAIADLIQVERDSAGKLDVAKAIDVPQYAEWLKEGLQPLPVRVVQTIKGQLNLIDGHRRVAAAMEVGHREVMALIWPAMPHPFGYTVGATGPVQLTGATFEYLPQTQQTYARQDAATRRLTSRIHDYQARYQ